MLLFNDKELAAHAKHLTTQAKIPHQWEFRHDESVTITACPISMLPSDVPRWRILNSLCSTNAKRLPVIRTFSRRSRGLNSSPNLQSCRSNYWLNAVITKDRDTRDGFLQYTNNNGIMSRPIWELMNRLPMFRNCQTDGLKNTEWFAERVVNIPSSIRL